MSEDSLSELVVALTDALVFEYADTRELPKEAITYDDGLVVFFDPTPDVGEVDTIIFAVIREGATERTS